MMACFSRGKGMVLVAFLGCLLPLKGMAGHRVVRIGVYQNPPKIFLSHGRLSGIFGDIVRHIADRSDWTLVPVPCQWKTCLSMIEQGKLDLMPDVAKTSERKKRMAFSRVAALYSWSELYRNRRSHLLSIKDLPGKRIAVLADSVQERFLKELVHAFGLQHVRFIDTPSLVEAFRLTAEGKADAVAANYFFGAMNAQKYHLVDTPVIFEPAQLYFVTPKNRGAELRWRIDTLLTRWQANSGSPYYRALRDWQGGRRNRKIPVLVWWGIGALVFLLVAVLLWSWLLRRKVQSKGQELLRSQFRQNLILDSVDANIYIKGLDLRYQYVNKSAMGFFKRPLEEIIGKRDDDLFDEETVSHIRQVDEYVLRTGKPVTREAMYSTQDGRSSQTFLIVRQPLRDEKGQVQAICGIATDFTEHKRNEDRIHQLAFYDTLTGLPNRTLLLDRARHALMNHARSNTNGALLFIDLDNFKVLNDTMGHAKGDLLLQQVARRLEEHVRKNDTLARLGGDEFVLLMEQLGQNHEEVAEHAVQVAKYLRRTLSELPFHLDGVLYNVTGSIGIALFSDAWEGGSVLYEDELIKLADLAMYASKNEGRNMVSLFNPRMQALIIKRAEMEALLHEAIRLEQIVLTYQAIVDNTGKLIGAEALVRWHHPEKGEIKPGEFVPYAETTGQIFPIGDWIVRSACRQLAAWQSQPEYRDLFLSVNVSVKQFYHPDFVSNVLEAIRQSGARAGALELELTESLLVHDMDNLVEKMNALKEAGVRFSLDDFGTGYSSLAYLKRLPLVQLKIDRSFVHDLLDNPNDRAIVRTVLALGNSLDLAVIAEGVESEQQYETLLAMGCLRFQGYLFGTPGPAEALHSRQAT